ncbi:MAG: sulfotransferase domain-containing protein [Pseudomonadota bacterium]
MTILHVSSHRRSGTHALIDLLRAHIDVHGVFFHLEELTEDALAQPLPLIVKSHEPFRGHKLARLKGVRPAAFLEEVERRSVYLYAHRNPYDVLKSLYYFNLAGDEPVYRIEERTPFGAFLAQTGVQDSATGENRVTFWFRCVRAWLNDAWVVPVSFDEIMRQPIEVLARVARTAQVPVRRAADVESTAVGPNTTAARAQADLWTAEARAFFRAYAHTPTLRRLDYPYLLR